MDGLMFPNVIHPFISAFNTQLCLDIFNLWQGTPSIFTAVPSDVDEQVLAGLVDVEDLVSEQAEAGGALQGQLPQGEGGCIRAQHRVAQDETDWGGTCQLIVFKFPRRSVYELQLIRFMDTKIYETDSHIYYYLFITHLHKITEGSTHKHTHTHTLYLQTIHFSIASRDRYSHGI